MGRKRGAKKKETDEPIVVTNREIEEAASALGALLGRKQRDYVTIFRLGKIKSTIEGTAEAVGKAMQQLRRDFAKTDADGEIIYVKQEDGSEGFRMDPRRFEQFEAEREKLQRERNRITGLRKLSAERLLRSMGWHPDSEIDDDEDEWEGVPAFLVTAMGPFLDIDIDEAGDMVAAEVESVEGQDASAPKVEKLPEDDG